MNIERILLDVETQKDFFCSGGRFYEPACDKAARNIRRLFTWAKATHTPVLSTVLRVRAGDLGPYGPLPHCVEGTEGEQKLRGAVLPRRVNLGLLNSTDLPSGLFGQHQQVIVEKRDTDIFAHARLERMITELRGVTFVICGAALAGGIAQAAVGLRSRGFGVIAVQDAILDLHDKLTPMAQLRMQAKGVIFVPTAEVVAPRPQRDAKPYRSVVAAKE